LEKGKDNYNNMIDLHTHSLLSDGELLPSELARRAFITGYKALAITDHVDTSNIDFVVPRLATAVKSIAGHMELDIIAGAEITHVPPKIIGGLVERARKLGARLVVVHGETIAEPVAPGTNAAGIEAGADILAHPGLISLKDAKRAQEQGVMLEITSRKRHSLSNGHVVKTALEAGASLCINTDAHSPEDLISAYRAKVILRGAGIAEETIETIFDNAKKLLEKIKQ
jgi:histidinol phosphatase-like PHP family hydrolase